MDFFRHFPSEVLEFSLYPCEKVDFSHFSSNKLDSWRLVVNFNWLLAGPIMQSTWYRRDFLNISSTKEANLVEANIANSDAVKNESFIYNFT